MSTAAIRRLRLAAVALQVLGATAVLAAVAQGIFLQMSFEASDGARYEAEVGSYLVGRSGLATLILLAGLAVGLLAQLVSRRARLRLAGVGVGVGAQAVGAALTVTVVVLGFGESDRRLNPSFAPQRAAVAAFPAPPTATPPTIDTEVSDNLRLDAEYDVQGTEDDVCPAMVKALPSWAAGGSVTTPEDRLNRYDRFVRRGPDTVQIQCFSGSRARTYLSLRLTRPR